MQICVVLRLGCSHLYPVLLAADDWEVVVLSVLPAEPVLSHITGVIVIPIHPRGPGLGAGVTV